MSKQSSDRCDSDADTKRHDSQDGTDNGNVEKSDYDADRYHNVCGDVAGNDHSNGYGEIHGNGYGETHGNGYGEVHGNVHKVTTDKLPGKKPGSNLHRTLSHQHKGVFTETPNIDTEKPRFAPLRLPLRRRLQTFAVFFFSTALSFSLALSFYLCSIPKLWPLIIIYGIWIFYDNSPNEGKLRTKTWMRRLKLFRWLCQYFPIHLHRTCELDPKKTYIFGYHPHGIIALGSFGAFGTDAAGFSKLFPGLHMTLLTLSANFRVPFYKEYLQSLGIMSVSRKSCQKLLSNGPGSSIAIVVGGAQESLLAQPLSNRLILKKRHGFIKLALTQGACLVPCFGFGENDIYGQLDVLPNTKLHRIQDFLRSVAGFTIPLFHGRGALNYDVGLLPWRKPLNIVVGRPIDVERVANPTQEQVLELLDKYIKELYRIWDEWKDIYLPDRQSELVLEQ